MSGREEYHEVGRDTSGSGVEARMGAKKKMRAKWCVASPALLVVSCGKWPEILLQIVNWTTFSVGVIGPSAASTVNRSVLVLPFFIHSNPDLLPAHIPTVASLPSHSIEKSAANMELTASSNIDIESLPRLFNFLKAKVSLGALEAELKKDPTLLQDINVPTARKGTPLLYCTVSRSLTKAQLLLSHGADPNIPSTLTKYNYTVPITPLFIACGVGFLPLASELLRHGASLTQTLENEIQGVPSIDLLGYTFYRMYQAGDPIPVLHWLVEEAKKRDQLSHFNFNLHLPGAIDKTLLGIAYHAKMWASAYLLLKYGADPNQVDRDGWSPLHTACQNDNGPEALLLMLHGANDGLRTTDDQSWMPPEKADAATSHFVKNGAIYRRFMAQKSGAGHD